MKVLKAGILVLEVLLVVQHVARGSVEKSEARKMREGPDLQGLLVMLRELNFHQRAGEERVGVNKIMGVAQTDLHFRVITLALCWRRERRKGRLESSDQFEDSFIHLKTIMSMVRTRY